MGYFIFDGTRSDTLGLLVSGTGVFDGPERDVTIVSPAGANDLVIDNGRYKNVVLTYPCAIKSGLTTVSRNVREWLCARAGGYYRLEDSYNTDEYRLARFKGPLTLAPWSALRGADLSITFDAKPQRYLKTGDTETTVNAGATVTLTNPTQNEAKPFLHVSPTTSGATVTINGVALQINTTYALDIDAEKRLIYRSTNKENYASVVVGEFPVLTAGNNTIAAKNCTVKIKPRWFRL